MSATTITALTRESGCEVRMQRKAAAPTPVTAPVSAGPPRERRIKSLGLLMLAASFVPITISGEVSATEGSFEAAVREELLRLGVSVPGADGSSHSPATLSRSAEAAQSEVTGCGSEGASEGCSEAPTLQMAAASDGDSDLSEGMPSLQLSPPEPAMDSDLPTVSWDQDAHALAAALSQLTGMLATAKGRLEEIERVREELNAAKPVTQAERDEAVAELRLAQEELSGLRQRHDELMAELAVVQDEHARLESELKDRDGTIAALNTDAEKRSEVLESLQRSIVERDQEILALEVEVTAAKDELDSLRRAAVSGSPVATDLADTVQELASGLVRYQQLTVSRDQAMRSLNDTAKLALARLDSRNEYADVSQQPALAATHEHNAPVEAMLEADSGASVIEDGPGGAGQISGQPAQDVNLSESPDHGVSLEQAASDVTRERDDATGAVTRYLAAFSSASPLAMANPWQDPELSPLHRALYRHQSKLAMLTDSRAVYTVKSDDYLSRIARQMYGDNAGWEKLYEANDHVLNDPNELIPGMVLIVP